MKLLFDQNLSPRLVRLLDDVYPESIHVYNVGLDRANDTTVWDYAKFRDYLIVSRDADYSDLSVMRGHPPKVVWIRRGNCTTIDIEVILRSQKAAIEILISDDNVGVLALF